jgi:hypothetical protein
VGDLPGCCRREIEFLTEPFVRRASEYFATVPEGVEAAVATARRIAEDPALRALAWHYHCAVYGREQGDSEQVRHWPVPERVLGPEARLFFSLVLLSGVRRMESEHRLHNIPEDVIRATLGDVRIGLRRREEDHPWGISPHDVGWFSNFLRGELYRLGRLQFQFGSFGYRLRAFRHFDTGAVLALSEDGVRYGADGQLQRGEDQEGAWTATLEVNDGRAVGYPVRPEGRAVRAPVTLPRREWKQVLAPRDPVLYVHIPGNGRQLMARSVRESFRWRSSSPRALRSSTSMASADRGSLTRGSARPSADLEHALSPSSVLVPVGWRRRRTAFG